MELNIAICDDNQTEIDQAKTLVHSVLNELKIKHNIFEFTSPVQLLQIERYYHFIFLDIQMGSLDGITTAKKLSAINSDSSIFFMTNHISYLDDALDEQPSRFFLKPLNKDRIRKCLIKSIKKIIAQEKYITVSVSSKPKQINVRYIIYVYMENKRLHIITTNGELLADDTFKAVTQQLDNVPFFSETCRGYYVNLKYVIEHSNQNVKCRCDEKSYNVCVSRRKYKNFCQKLIEWTVFEK